MSKEPFRFSLIKRQPDEPTIVLASDFNSRPIPWNEIIEVIEVPYDKLDAITAKVKQLEDEVNEQCRINGMGAQRELALMTKVKRYEEALKKYSTGEVDFFEDEGLTARAALNQGEGK